MSSPPSGPRRYPDALRYAGFGIQLAATVAVLAWAGQWLDRRFGTGGILTVLLVLIGFAGALAGLVRELKERGRQDR